MRICDPALLTLFVVGGHLAPADAQAQEAAEPTPPAEAPPLSGAATDSKPAPTPAPTGGERGSCLGPTVTGVAVCAGSNVVGCAATGLGLLFTTVDPGGGDNCIEDCILGVVGALFVAVGLVIAAVGVLVLGPVAAVGVTAAVVVAAALADRSPWLALVGGSPGILLGLAAVVTGAAAMAATDGAGAFDRILDPEQPGASLVFATVALAALSGPVALVGALGADAAGGLFATNPAQASAQSERKAREHPLAFHPRASTTVAF